MNELALKINNDPILSFQKKFPRWACDERNNWMAIRELRGEELPPVEKVDKFIALVESKKATLNQAVTFSKELSKFYSKTNDRRFESKRFANIILGILMNYPVTVVDQGITQIMKNHNWFPEPVIIEKILNEICMPIKAPLDRAKNFKRRHNQLLPKPQNKPMTEAQKEAFGKMEMSPNA